MLRSFDHSLLLEFTVIGRHGHRSARPGLGTFVTRSPSGTDPATPVRFLTALTDWLRSARSAGLGPDDIEAIYRTAYIDSSIRRKGSGCCRPLT
jgi:GntR family transcriptional regulator